MRNPQLLPAIAAALFLTPLTLAAGELPQVEMCRSPFSFFLPNRAWCPVMTRISNPTDRDRELVVSLAFDLGPGDAVSYTRRVWVPAWSKRTVETFVLMDYPPRSLGMLFDEREQQKRFPDGTELRCFRRKIRDKFFLNAGIAEARGGRQYPSYQWNAFPLHPDSRMLVVADGRKDQLTTRVAYTYRGLPYVLGVHPRDHRFLTGAEPEKSDAYNDGCDPLPEEIDAGLRRAMLNLGDLPGKWAAYEGVDTLVLGSLQRNDRVHGLSPQQRHSLLRWVRSGGRLVIIPAYDLDTYGHPFWRMLLPVRLVGTRLLDDGVEPLQRRYGKRIPFDRARPPVLVEALAGEGEVLERDGERVLLARREVGTGEVWFLALTGDSMAAWSRAHRLWARILHPRSDPVPGLYHGFADNAADFLARIVGAKAPAPALISMLLGAYFLLALVALVVCRRLGRQEWGWAMVIPLSVLGLGGAGFIANASRAKVGFVHGEVGVTVLRAGTARGATTSFVGLFSPTRSTTDLEWLSPDTLATGYASWLRTGAGGGPRRSQPVLEKNRYVFPQVRLNPGELKVSRAMTMSRFGEGVEVEFGYGAAGFTGRVKNRTGRVLRHCILRANRRSLRVGDLAPGASRDLSSCPLSWAPTDSDFATSDADKVRRYLLAEVLRPPRRLGFSSQRRFSWPVTLYCWDDLPRARLRMGEHKPRERALQLLAVEVTRVRHDRKVKVPAGACGLRLLRGGNRMAYGSARRFQTFGNVDLPTRGTLIAGSRHRPQRKRPHLTAPPSSAGDDALRTRADQPSEQERHRPVGWLPGINPTSVRVAFDRPQGLERLRVRKLTLVVDLALSGFTADVRIRRPGTRSFRRLPGADKVSGGKLRAVLAGATLARLLGAGGELPEFELRLSLPPGQAVTTSGRWEVRVFDVELEGEMPR